MTDFLELTSLSPHSFNRTLDADSISSWKLISLTYDSLVARRLAFTWDTGQFRIGASHEETLPLDACFASIFGLVGDFDSETSLESDSVDVSEHPRKRPWWVLVDDITFDLGDVDSLNTTPSFSSRLIILDIAAVSTRWTVLPVRVILRPRDRDGCW